VPPQVVPQAPCLPLRSVIRRAKSGPVARLVPRTMPCHSGRSINWRKQSRYAMKNSRVARAQAQCALEAAHRRLVLTAKNSYPAAVVPCRCQVGVERERLINEGETSIDVTSNIRKSVPAPTERNRVIPAQFCSSPGQPCSFRDLLHEVLHPAVRLAYHVTPRSHTIG